MMAVSLPLELPLLNRAVRAGVAPRGAQPA